jgi:hypothetical protein
VIRSLWFPALLAALVATFAVAGTAHADPIQGRPRIVSGPATTTDDAVCVWSGATGRYINNSLVTIDPVSGDIDLPADATVDGVNISELAAAGGGDVDGPASSVDNTIPRWNLTTGKLLQGSGLVISDEDLLSIPTATLTSTSLVQSAVHVTGTVNQASGTGGYAAFRANPTITACGSAGCNLLHLQSGSTNRLRVDGSGNIVQSSAATAGHRIYNTADEATNTEYLEAAWSGNVANLRTARAGSGTARNLALSSLASLVIGGSGSGSVTVTSTGAGIAIPEFLVTHTTTMNSASNTQTAVSVTGVVDQAGTAGYNGYLCGPILTAVGSAGAKCFRAAPGGVDRWWVDSTGTQDADSTITAAATTGNQTISKPCGTVNLAAAATSVTVTNTLVTANTILNPVARTNDSTCAVKNYVPAAGSFVINMTAACTAETSVGWCVVDKN